MSALRSRSDLRREPRSQAIIVLAQPTPAGKPASMAAQERRLPSPPHNPGVRDLVEGKRTWDPLANSTDQKAGFRGWHERGYLPHRDSPGLTQFITYHLADAFPAE